jgi:hypothetical protein
MDLQKFTHKETLSRVDPRLLGTVLLLLLLLLYYNKFLQGIYRYITEITTLQRNISLKVSGSYIL